MLKKLVNASYNHPKGSEAFTIARKLANDKLSYARELIKITTQKHNNKIPK